MKNTVNKALVDELFVQLDELKTLDLSHPLAPEVQKKADEFLKDVMDKFPLPATYDVDALSQEFLEFVELVSNSQSWLTKEAIMEYSEILFPLIFARYIFGNLGIYIPIQKLAEVYFPIMNAAFKKIDTALKIS